MQRKTLSNGLKLATLALAVLVFALAYDGFASRAQAQDAKPLDPQQALAALNKQIEGQEQKPAEQVFKNIQTFKGAPAKRVLLVMNAYTRALGVDCAYCHTPEQWDKDDKPTKTTARDMMRMTAAINNDFVKAMKNVAPNASVSCSTCHRGQPHPDARLPEAKPKAD
ncbi:MAG: c-type cytochrome [Pyrinomonadaceae bacterium]